MHNTRQGTATTWRTHGTPRRTVASANYLLHRRIICCIVAGGDRRSVTSSRYGPASSWTIPRHAYLRQRLCILRRVGQCQLAGSPLQCAYARVCSCGAARHSTTGIDTSPRPAPNARATYALRFGADVGHFATSPLRAKARPHGRSKGMGAELSCEIDRRHFARYLRNWRVPRSIRVMSRDGWSRGSSRHACSREYTSNCARHEPTSFPRHN